MLHQYLLPAYTFLPAGDGDVEAQYSVPEEAVSGSHMRNDVYFELSSVVLCWWAMTSNKARRLQAGKKEILDNLSVVINEAADDIFSRALSRLSETSPAGSKHQRVGSSRVSHQ